MSKHELSGLKCLFKIAHLEKIFVSGENEGTERRSRQLQFSAAICRSNLASEIVIA
jgi:hypothetical protein